MRPGEAPLAIRLALRVVTCLEVTSGAALAGFEAVGAQLQGAEAGRSPRLAAFRKISRRGARSVKWTFAGVLVLAGAAMVMALALNESARNRREDAASTPPTHAVGAAPARPCRAGANTEPSRVMQPACTGLPLPSPQTHH